MENEIICLDTSVLIDFYRKTVKENSIFYQLTTKYKLFAVSIVTEYEIMIGQTLNKRNTGQIFLTGLQSFRLTKLRTTLR
jgi:predicted nucleic acid-binding protein